MAAFLPFQANTGGTVSVAAVSTSASGSVTISASLLSGLSTSMLVTNTNSVTVFVRMDKSTATLASSIDIPIAGSSARLLANPYPLGPTVVSVAATLLGSSSGASVFFTPGQGGI